MCLLAVLGLQGIVVKCTYSAFYIGLLYEHARSSSCTLCHKEFLFCMQMNAAEKKNGLQILLCSLPLNGM